MPSELFAALLALAEERMRELHVPGAAIGLVADGTTELAGLGVTDADHPRPVGPDTVFSIASITKTFTAGVLASLAREGRLSLDDPVRRHVPELRLSDERASSALTVRHLLTHTGGWIGEELPSPLDGDDAFRRAASACRVMRQVTAPGELFSYNNVGFIVAGGVVEAAAGATYEDVVRERMLRPLGMTRTDFIVPRDGDVAAEHSVREGQAVVIEGWENARSSRPVGGLRSTVRDLLRYAQAHLDGTLRLDHGRAAIPTGAPQRAQGIGWAIATTGGATVFSHGGATVAHMSLLAVVPERRFAVVVLTNGALGGQLTGAIVRRALTGAGVPADAEPETRVAAPSDAGARAGRYEWPTSDIELLATDGGYELRLAWKGSVAARPAPAPVRLEPWDDTHVVGRDGWAKGGYGDFPKRGLFRWGARARPRAA